jgi:hypothetical protein
VASFFYHHTPTILSTRQSRRRYWAVSKEKEWGQENVLPSAAMSGLILLPPFSYHSPTILPKRQSRRRYWAASKVKECGQENVLPSAAMSGLILLPPFSYHSFHASKSATILGCEQGKRMRAGECFAKCYHEWPHSFATILLPFFPRVKVGDDTGL